MFETGQRFANFLTKKHYFDLFQTSYKVIN